MGKRRFSFVVGSLKSEALEAVTASFAAHAQCCPTAETPIQTSRQAQTHTDEREPATAFIRPRPSLASTNLGPGPKTNRDHIASAVFDFFNFFYFIYLF